MATAYESPYPKFQAFDDNGDPLSGGKLYTYVNGTTTPKNTYTTSAAAVANANPVILDSRGEANVWLDGTYTLVLKDSNDVQIWSIDNITGVGSTSDTLDQWVVSGLTPTFASATSFTLSGDQTDDFEVGRRIKTTNSGGTVYSTIITSTYADVTTVTTVNDDSASLDSGLSAVSLSILTTTNRAYPNILIDTDSTLCSHKNLVVVNNTTNPTYQLDIDADDLILYNTNGARVGVSSVDLTLDIAESGANGLDTGSEANSTWYHAWVIFNGTTIAGLLSASATAPTMPSGYTYKGYVGAIYNDSGGDFINISQKNKFVAIEQITDLSAGTDGTLTSVTLTVPTTALKVVGYMRGANGVGDASVEICSTSTSYNKQYLSIVIGGASSADSIVPYSCFLIEAQTIYYRRIEPSTSAYIYTTGWEY